MKPALKFTISSTYRYENLSTANNTKLHERIKFFLNCLTFLIDKHHDLPVIWFFSLLLLDPFFIYQNKPFSIKSIMVLFF